MRKKLLSILALLCLTVTSAWALTLKDGDTWDDATKTLTVSSDPGTGAYMNQTEIVHLVISSSVTSINNNAFRGCTDLTDVTIGSSVTNIGNSVFFGCTSLTSITIPDEVTTIGNAVFSGCSNLAKVTIGSGVTSISQNLFRSCTSLTSIILPSSVTTISANAFYNCTNLTSVTVKAESCTLANTNAFTNCPLTNIFVPSGSEDYYTTNWSGISSSLEFLTAPENYSVTAKSAGGAYWSTFYTAADNYQASEGTQVFAVNLDGTTLTMTEIEDRIAKSGEGVVLKNTTTGSITMTLTEEASAGDFSANSLKGTMTEIKTTGANNYYVLGIKNGAGFYKLSNTSGIIGANKAYLIYDGSTPAPARGYFLFDEATGIEMPTAEGNDFDGTVYDLQGRRVQNPTKGLYIVNGKKVFINK